MANTIPGWQRQGEAFWREHHERWKRSDLNQREYCEAMNLPLKSFSNWRCMFRKEPEVARRKLLWRRGGSSHTLSHSPSHTLSHTLSHVTHPTSQAPPPLVVPPPRDGHKRRFSEAERRRIVAETEQPGASVSQIARRYDIARRVLCRWREELAAPVFVEVKVTDGETP